MEMAPLMAKSIFMYILGQYFVRGNYHRSEMVPMCVKQNDSEVQNVLIRPFQGDLGTFSCVTSLPPRRRAVSGVSLTREKRSAPNVEVR